MKCESCGVSGEKWFTWNGECLNCEENSESFDDECDCGEDICCCLYPSNYESL